MSWLPVNVQNYAGSYMQQQHADLVSCLWTVMLICQCIPMYNDHYNKAAVFVLLFCQLEQGSARIVAITD